MLVLVLQAAEPTTWRFCVTQHHSLLSFQRVKKRRQNTSDIFELYYISWFCGEFNVKGDAGPILTHFMLLYTNKLLSIMQHLTKTLSCRNAPQRWFNHELHVGQVKKTPRKREFMVTIHVSILKCVLVATFYFP